LACLGVAAPSGLLFLNHELPKPADQEVFAILEGPFHDFQKLFNHLAGVALSKTKLRVNFVDDFVFGQGHLVHPFQADEILFF
jgi:hypothetical protein